MNFDQARPFLESHHWGIVTTHQRDGAAQNSIVYCGAYRGQAVFVAVYGKSAKVRNLRRDPRCTVLAVAKGLEKLGDGRGGRATLRLRQHRGRGDARPVPRNVQRLRRP